MIDPGVAAKLRDPAYFSLHLQAARAIRHVGQLEWYDSDFLRRFEVARHYLGIVRPDSLDTFLGGFAPIKPEDDFSPITIDDVFDDATRKEIIRVAQEVQPESDHYQDYENSEFGRRVIWDNDFIRDPPGGLACIRCLIRRPWWNRPRMKQIANAMGKMLVKLDDSHDDKIRRITLSASGFRCKSQLIVMRRAKPR